MRVGQPYGPFFLFSNNYKNNNAVWFFCEVKCSLNVRNAFLLFFYLNTKKIGRQCDTGNVGQDTCTRHLMLLFYLQPKLFSTFQQLKFGHQKGIEQAKKALWIHVSFRWLYINGHTIHLSLVP